MIPPLSPYGLIQESLWPNEWHILVVCMLLNCTTRKQVEKVWPAFVKLFPTPHALIASEPELIADTIKSLGFKDRRTKNLLAMSRAYVAGEWKHAKELPGIGDYGAASWEIFCAGVMPDVEPKDHALVLYYRWRRRHGV